MRNMFYIYFLKLVFTPEINRFAAAYLPYNLSHVPNEKHIFRKKKLEDSMVYFQEIDDCSTTNSISCSENR